MDFIFNNIHFGTVGFINTDSKESGWLIVFNKEHELNTSIKDLIESLEKGDEKYNCYSILDINETVEKVRAFSNPESIKILTKEYDSTTTINEALVALRNIYISPITVS